MKPQLGITYSHTHAMALGLNPIKSLEECLRWPIEYVRLCAYWSEIEREPGKYDFHFLKKILTLCQRHQKKVLLTFGVKAPRWPEFYYPPFVEPNLKNAQTSERLFTFIRKTVEALQDFPCITHWQIENEPLDPSGPQHAVVPYEFLQRESELVRSLDSRPIVLSLWGNDLSIRGLWSKAEGLADVIGLDIYFKQFVRRLFGFNFYRGPLDTDEKLQLKIIRTPKPVWITELQAEPWEHADTGYRSRNPGSMNPLQLTKNFERAKKLGAEVILFWGAEYWLWRAKQGDERYVSFIHNCQK